MCPALGFAELGLYMTPQTLILAVALLGVLGFFMGRRRALSSANHDPRLMHSLPHYYGVFVFLMTLVPAMLILAIWVLAQPMIVSSLASDLVLPQSIPDGSSLGLIMSDVTRMAQALTLAAGQGIVDLATLGAAADATTQMGDILTSVGVAVGSQMTDDMVQSALDMVRLTATGDWAMTVAIGAIALAGFAYSMARMSKSFWARNAVERFILVTLISAAAIAILTTIGIVLSMVFETLRFFSLHDWTDFFFGLEWAPNFRGDSALSILPLLWGTLYISIVALLVATPIGLFSAIYLAEYASKSTRGIAKPLLEVLAGIPTIVYGLFALITFGPFLKDIFGEGGILGVDWMGDARSVATAGIVMGIMLIPFVSSLSDDIINAVPQAMRDGSYGLGATKSETIRQVVLPAALPGIVGAILLAASRAIGETMIVVLGAGAIARFAGNPLEALTTITTRIVSQLTGDGDFNSPETIVAFALGLTLFVLTLGLNIIALYIVRKYREQYE